MIIENTQDLILVIASACGAITAIIAAFRMSRCQYLNFCKGCFIMKREINEKKSKEEINNLTPSPSELSLDNNNNVNNNILNV